MSNGIGSIMINNKNYSGLKIGSKYAKRLTEIIDSNSVLTINCSEGNNILKISNQLEKQIEYVKIFNINNLNEDLATEVNEWTLPDGTYKVYIKGEFNCVGSTCKFIEIELSEELTTGYKMFYNCNVNTANSDYEIIIPGSMTNVESMFEKSNLTATVNLDFNIIENCKNMYKDCFNLKQIGQEYINIFNNEHVLVPNLIDYENCFAGCENIYCGNNNVNEDKPRLFNWKDIPIIWGGPIINMAFAYYNRYEMKAEPFTGPYVIDMNSTYWNCTNLIGSPAIGPNVINASSTYYNCRKLTGNPVCGNNVTDMSYTYTNCYKLIGNPVCGDNVTDISYAYYNCTNITGNPVCGNNVIYMSNTYYQCYNLTGNPVCGNNVVNMSSTYQRCCNLTGSPVCGNNVTDMSKTYLNCCNLTGSPACGNNVTNMYYTYFNCYKLTGSPACGNNVTDMAYTYYNCRNITGSPVCGNNVTDMYSAYYNCIKLTGSPVCGPNVTTMGQAYYNCQKLTGSPVCGPNVTDMSGTYERCYNLTGSPVCGNNVTNMYYTYAYCNNLTGSPVCGPNVINMTYAYMDCYNLTGNPVCGPNVTSMYETYRNCQKLTGSPVCGDKVTTMVNTYYNCKNLTGSPVCGPNVTNMYQTYYNCPNIYGYMDVKSSSIANAVNCFYGRDTSKMLTITVGFTTTSYNTFKTNAITNSTLIWTPAENSSMYYYNDAANIVIFNSAVSSMRLAFGNARTPFRAACGSRVTDMQQAYYNCRNLVGPPACGPNVTDMNSTYYRCYNISGQPVCGNRVWTMRNAYYRCGNLTGQPVCGPNVTTMHNAYYKCPNLYGDFYVYSDNVSNATGCFFERDTSRRLNIIATDGSISQTNFMYTNTFADPDGNASNVTGTLSLVVSTSDKPEFEYMLYNSIYNVYFYTNLFWGGGSN